MIITSFDTSKLHRGFAEWAKAAGVSLGDAITYQAALLKQDLVDLSPPRNKDKAIARAERNVKSHFTVMPPRPFYGGKANGKRNTRWLYASNFGKKILLGIDNSLLMPGAPMETIERIYYSGAAKKTSGKKFAVAGARKSGREIVMAQKPMVRRGVIRSLAKKIGERFGKLKAAWAADADKLGRQMRLPNWVAVHVKSARGDTKVTKTKDRATVTINNRSFGVEHETSLRMIKSAVTRRVAAMKKDASLYLNQTKKAAGLRGTIN